MDWLTFFKLANILFRITQKRLELEHQNWLGDGSHKRQFFWSSFATWRKIGSRSVAFHSYVKEKVKLLFIGLLIALVQIFFFIKFLMHGLAVLGYLPKEDGTNFRRAFSS